MVSFSFVQHAQKELEKVNDWEAYKYNIQAIEGSMGWLSCSEDDYLHQPHHDTSSHCEFEICKRFGELIGDFSDRVHKAAEHPQNQGARSCSCKKYITHSDFAHASLERKLDIMAPSQLSWFVMRSPPRHLQQRRGHAQSSTIFKEIVCTLKMISTYCTERFWVPCTHLISKAI